MSGSSCALLAVPCSGRSVFSHLLTRAVAGVKENAGGQKRPAFCSSILNRRASLPRHAHRGAPTTACLSAATSHQHRYAPRHYTLSRRYTYRCRCDGHFRGVEHANAIRVLPARIYLHS